MLACNLGHQALIQGHTVLFITAGQLLFELISRRYEHKSTVITTNRAFKEWYEVFPNAACVVSLIDRLVHRCEIVAIEGESYRLKEAKARSEKKATTRAAAPRKGKTP